MKGEAEWDEVVIIECAAYSFFPNGQSHQSTFLLMFGRDVYISTLAGLL